MMDIPADRGRRFVGLHWKGFLWLSALLLVLSGALHWLNYYHLMRQFRQQREGEVHAFRQQISGLVKGSSDRLVRLGSAVLSIEGVGEGLRGDEMADLRAGERYASLGYDLEVQRIELFTIEGKRAWGWPDSGVGLSDARQRAVLNQVRREEKPVTLLDCQPQCLLYAFVPILLRGKNIGSLGLAQSIADLVIEFKALTGTDIGIVVPAGKVKAHLPSWSGLVSALTNTSQLKPFLEDLGRRYPDPEALNRGALIEWSTATYDVRRLPIAEFMPSEAGFIVLISDVSPRLYEIQVATRQGFIATLVALAVAELILLFLVRVPSRRLRWFAQTLPLLAQGAFENARERLSGQRSGTRFRDEIDSLYDTASQLSDRLEATTVKLEASRQALERANLDLREEIAERKKMQEALGTLSRKLIETQETERRHIARELHDEIGQSLTALKINLESLQSVSVKAPPHFEDSLDLVGRTLAQVRSLSLDLRPPLLDDLGLVPALRWYLDQQAQRVGFSTTLSAATIGPRPSPDVENACFRIVQEAVTNISRYAQARHVWVTVRRVAEGLELIVRDDGHGFDVETARQDATQGASLGLLGMEERAMLVGGRVQIASAPGEGTEIRAVLPINTEEKAGWSRSAFC